MKKKMAILSSILIASSNVMAGTAYLEIKGNSRTYDDLKISRITTGLPDSDRAGSVEIEVSNPTMNTMNHLRIDKKLLAILNIDSASFIQLMLNKGLKDVTLMCLNASQVYPGNIIYYRCEGISVLVGD